MHPSFINNVSQILNLGHAKSALLQISTQLVLPQCLEDLSDVVKVLFPSLAKYQNVIKYTTTNELVNGRKMSSINLMKVARAFVNSKCMTSHSKRPSLALKEVFHTSEGSIGTWWYSDIKSILLKYFPTWVGPEGHQSLGSDIYSKKWSCSMPDTKSPSPILLLHQHVRAPIGRWT